MKEMPESMAARTGAEAIASFGQGRSWESAFRNLNQAIELIYLMCELESSVVFVDHAARVFKEASENFEELKLRIQDQLRFQSYIEESQVDHLSIAWEVPSFKQDYSRNVPEEGAVDLYDVGGLEDHNRQDSTADEGSSLGPFPEHKEWSTHSGRCDDADSRAASTGGISSSFQPLIPWSEACVVAPYHRRPPGLSDSVASPPLSPGDAGANAASASGEQPGERRGASVGHAWVPKRGTLTCAARMRSDSSPRTGRTPAGSGAPRSLHSKLLSPERFKRDPDETRRLAAEKQRRAEKQRSVLEAERLAKLEKVKQEREAVRSVQGEQQAVRLRELRMRHALSQERRRTTLLGIVARATDESDKVKEVQFIRRMEAASLRAALDARLERSGERRRVVLANRQLRHGRDVDDALEDAQRRKREKEEARMEELFEKLQRKEEALARFEEERRRGVRAAGDTASGDPEVDAADAAVQAQHETPKQRRERLEAERAEERHAALERRLQEAAERRERMLAAIRAAAAAPGAPGGAAQPGSSRESPTKPEKPQALSSHGAASVAQEGWAHRVLKSRGVDPSDSIGTAAAPANVGQAPKGASGPAAQAAPAAALPARSAGQVYSSMMKTLRSKAAKLRRRLLEEVALEAVDGGPLGGDASAGDVAAARGVPQDLVDAGESLAQEICYAMDAQDPQALSHALLCVENHATATDPAPSPLPPGDPTAGRPSTGTPQSTATTPRTFHAPPWGPFVSAARSTNLLRAVVAAAAAAACGGGLADASTAPDTSTAWPPGVLLAACSALSALLADPCNRVAMLSLPAIVFFIDGLRTLLDAAIDCVAPVLPDAPPPTPALDALTSVIILLLQSSPLAIAARVRRCDVISYALAAGILYRMAHLFLLVHGAPHADEVPPCVRRSLVLLELLTAVDARAVLHMDGGRQAEAAFGEHHVRFRVKGIASNLVTMFKDTSLVGLSALLSAFLHPAASAAPRSWDGAAPASGCTGSPPALTRPSRGGAAAALPPPPSAELLPAKLLPAALSAMRALNGVLLLARRDVQALLAAPDLSSELLFVLGAVVTLCTARWPGDDGVVALLLHEAVLLLGLFAAQHPGHQKKLSWGPAPSVLQRLCTIPSLYLETACLPNGCLALEPPTAPAASAPVDAEPGTSHHSSPGRTVAPEAPVPTDASELDPAVPQQPGVAGASDTNAAGEGPAAAGGGRSAAAAEPPTYLLHVLFPTLLAACLDAPRNCAAVCECLGSSGVLAYCAAQSPPGGNTAGSVASGRRCCAAPGEAANGRGGVRGGQEATAQQAGAHGAQAQNDWEWDIDLGPLDGRFHPRHRIARADWSRAEAQLRAAAVHTPRSVSDAASGGSGAAHAPGSGCVHERPGDSRVEWHLGPNDCVAAGATPTASVECHRMTQESAIRSSDSHEGAA
eukprot:jgi/Ulvmu1/814/UM010_0188.1